MNQTRMIFAVAGLIAGAATTLLYLPIASIADGVQRGCSEIADKPFGCFEALINRYQTAIAAIVAWLALASAFGQLKEARRQSAASAVVALERAVGTRIVERDNAKELMRKAFSLLSDAVDKRGSTTLGDIFLALHEVGTVVRNGSVMHPGDESITNARNGLIDEILSGEQKTIKAPPASQLRDFEFRKLIEEIHHPLAEQFSVYVAAMDANIADRWVHIAKLERAAAGKR